MRTLLILLLSPGTANAILSDLTPGGYGPRPPIPTVAVEFFQNHFGPVGVQTRPQVADFGCGRPATAVQFAAQRQAAANAGSHGDVEHAGGVATRAQASLGQRRTRKPPSTTNAMNARCRTRTASARMRQITAA